MTEPKPLRYPLPVHPDDRAYFPDERRDRHGVKNDRVALSLLEALEDWRVHQDPRVLAILMKEALYEAERIEPQLRERAARRCRSRA